MRRKIVRKTKPSTAQDDKKLQGALKKLNVQPIPGVEEVNMFREDGNVLHFTAPKGECLVIYFVPFSSHSYILARSVRLGAIFYFGGSGWFIPIVLTVPLPRHTHSPRGPFRQHLRHLRYRSGEGAHGARSRYPQSARTRLARIAA